MIKKQMATKTSNDIKCLFIRIVKPVWYNRGIVRHIVAIDQDVRFLYKGFGSIVGSNGTDSTDGLREMCINGRSLHRVDSL